MRHHHLLVVVAVVALGATACSGSASSGEGETVSPVGQPSASTAPASPSPSATPEVTSEAVDLDLPRTTVLGGLATTLRGVAVGNATPGTALDPEPEPGDQAYAYLDTVVGWEDGYPGGSTQVEVDWYALVLADGTVVPPEAVDFASAHPVRDGQPAEVLFAFPVDGADDVTAATLRVGDTGQAPAELPLDGATPDDPYPIALDVSGEGPASIEGGCGDGTATTTLVSGEVDLDGGIDQADERIVLNGIARAGDGEVYVRLTVRTVAQSGSCGGAIVNDDQYRLVVDTLPTAPLNSHVELLDPGTGTELVFGWLVPSDATLELVVGTPDGDTQATFPVPLPDLPA